MPFPNWRGNEVKLLKSASVSCALIVTALLLTNTNLYGQGRKANAIDLKAKRQEIINRVRILRAEFEKVLKRKPGAKRMAVNCKLDQYLQEDREFLTKSKAYTSPFLPLTVDDRLMKAGQDHSDWVINSKIFAHSRIGTYKDKPYNRAKTDPSKARYSYGQYKWTDNSPLDRMVNYGYFGSMGQENLAGLGLDAEKCVEMWWNSKGHRRTMLYPGYSRVGIGVSLNNNKSGVICCLMIARSDENYRGRRRQASTTERKKLGDDLFRLLNDMRRDPKRFVRRFSEKRHFFSHPMDAAALRGVNATTLKRNLDALNRAAPVDGFQRGADLDASAMQHLALRSATPPANKWNDRGFWQHQGEYINNYQGIPRAEDIVISWLSTSTKVLERLRDPRLSKAGVAFGYPRWSNGSRDGWFVVHYRNPITFFIKSGSREIVIPPSIAQKALLGFELNPGDLRKRTTTYLPGTFVAAQSPPRGGVTEFKPKVQLWIKKAKNPNGDMVVMMPFKKNVGGKKPFEEFYGRIGFETVSNQKWGGFIRYVYSRSLKSSPYKGGSRVAIGSIWVK